LENHHDGLRGRPFWGGRRRSLLRPTWEETEDETDADLAPRRPLTRPAGLQDWSAAADAWRALLLPLCAATDLLARLDVRAEVATSGVREGLIARLAYLEAAGFLAHAHAWAHPLDLALREHGFTARASPSRLESQPCAGRGSETPPKYDS
jgi:hypothetical protein